MRQFPLVVLAVEFSPMVVGRGGKGTCQDCQFLRRPRGSGKKRSVNVRGLQRSILTDESLQPTGGAFGRSFRPATVSLPAWGDLELQLDCQGGEAIYASDLGSFSDGRQQLVPLTRLKNPGCLH